MAPFYGWGSTALRLEPLRGGSLLFTTKFPEIHGTHFAHEQMYHESLRKIIKICEKVWLWNKFVLCNGSVYLKFARNSL